MPLVVAVSVLLVLGSIISFDSLSSSLGNGTAEGTVSSSAVIGLLDVSKSEFGGAKAFSGASRVIAIPFLTGVRVVKVDVVDAEVSINITFAII